MASFSVVSNIASANAQANLQATNIGLNKALSRLSSGFRINKSGDDAAGLAVANIVSQRRGDHEPGHPQRQRRPVQAADQGRRARQHRDRARPPGDPGDPGGFDAPAASTSPSCRPSTRRDRTEIDREAAVAGHDGAAPSFSVFVSSEATVGNGAVSAARSAGVESADLRHHADHASRRSAQAQTALAQIEDAISTLGTCRTPSAPCRTA